MEGFTWKACTIIGGIYMFFVTERILKMITDYYVVSNRMAWCCSEWCCDMWAANEWGDTRPMGRHPLLCRLHIYICGRRRVYDKTGVNRQVHLWQTMYWLCYTVVVLCWHIIALMWKCKNNLSLKVKKYNQLKKLPFHRGFKWRERERLGKSALLLLLCNAS